MAEADIKQQADTKPKTEQEDMEGSENPESLTLTQTVSAKHPLENKWSLWYFKNDRAKDWSENLKLVHTFGFVEDFWALYHYIQPASRLGNGCDYSVFKEGIQPAWEDERNKRGGRWMINVNKNQRYEELDRFWLDILLCLIGEAFGDYSDEVCGAVVNIRTKGDKVGVWTSNAKNGDATVFIGKKLKETLSIPDKVKIVYQLHDDSMTKTGSMTKSTYTV